MNHGRSPEVLAHKIYKLLTHLYFTAFDLSACPPLSSADVPLKERSFQLLLAQKCRPAKCLSNQTFRNITARPVGTICETCDHFNFSSGCFLHAKENAQPAPRIPQRPASLRRCLCVPSDTALVCGANLVGAVRIWKIRRARVSCFPSARLVFHMIVRSTCAFPRRLATSRRHWPGLVVFPKHFGVGQQNIYARKRCGTAFPSLSIQFSFRYFLSKASQNTAKG
ncbi:Hypothetical_protein [Hexamita inflata]|uniref:Hypothetical_protein n=1 Tax=Hexamita inflata TaxID=28002 RepID=A0ABP1HAS9_9EUKA